MAPGWLESYPSTEAPSRCDNSFLRYPVKIGSFESHSSISTINQRSISIRSRSQAMGYWIFALKTKDISKQSFVPMETFGKLVKNYTTYLLHFQPTSPMAKIYKYCAGFFLGIIAIIPLLDNNLLWFRFSKEIHFNMNISKSGFEFFKISN